MAFDIKLVFVTVSLIVLSYNIEVDSSVDEYSIKACQKYRITQRELFYFVTYPEIVDKV